MDRRAFLRRAAIVASGAIAADQLELLDRLGWVRRFFAGLGAGLVQPNSTSCTSDQWHALLGDDYVRNAIADAVNVVTPFKAMLRRPTRLVLPEHASTAFPRYVVIRV